MKWVELIRLALSDGIELTYLSRQVACTHVRFCGMLNLVSLDLAIQLALSLFDYFSLLCSFDCVWYVGMYTYVLYVHISAYRLLCVVCITENRHTVL